MDNEKKLQYLQYIYSQQHYFVDRHDSMAEKFINILLVEVTCLSVVYAFIFSDNYFYPLEGFQILPIVLFVFFVCGVISQVAIYYPSTVYKSEKIC